MRGVDYSKLMRRQLVNLGSEDEIAFRQAVDFVGPERQLYFSPGQINVGVVVLRLSQFADAISVLERLAEVGEFELPLKVVFVDNLPGGIELSRQAGQLLARQRRDAALAGHTFLLC